ncbi:hypothetical protein POM88_022545 [Heracleum sosnowskyi]|uniref:C2H2-type domain-containing protein n=1 Tax=Heracleum sosnowskyi TaxID=360622 RepID=A0AAD8MPR1_9APIA|nr:hypothetical protein POM88_022543 [Heracleum sosnowskyi]KAK1384810.1 hypothetical protein POM88_022545 [Heracleum sosnowskyi]
MECNQRSSSSSGTTDNKSKIHLKFKIPKICSSAVDQEAGGSSSSAEQKMMNINTMMISSNNNTRRVCPKCNKEFESGKALAGHMRIHSQAAVRKQASYKIHPRSDSENSSMSDKILPCNHCTKIFPSLKSLFGHMRCHPERDGRGIRPPRPNYSWSSSENDDDDDDDDDEDDEDDEDEEEEEDYGYDGYMVFDCAQVMPRWPVKGPVTARRGRRGIKRGLSVGCEEMLRGGADGLNPVLDSSDSSGLSILSAVVVQQINGGSWTDNNREQINEQAGKVDDYDPVPVMRKLGIEEGGSSDHVMKNYIGSVGQEGNYAAVHFVENHHVEVESNGMNTELVLGGVGGHKHFDGINDKDNHREKLVMGNSKNCKDKKMKMKMGLNQEKAPAVGSSLQVVGASTATNKYKCSSCDKTFSSHQALGGHRASHNKFTVSIINGNGDSSTSKRPPQQPSSVSAIAPPALKLNKSPDQAAGKRIRLMGFDVDVPASMVDN